MIVVPCLINEAGVTLVVAGEIGIGLGRYGPRSGEYVVSNDRRHGHRPNVDEGRSVGSLVYEGVVDDVQIVSYNFV